MWLPNWMPSAPSSKAPKALRRCEHGIGGMKLTDSFNEPVSFGCFISDESESNHDDVPEIEASGGGLAGAVARDGGAAGSGALALDPARRCGVSLADGFQAVCERHGGEPDPDHGAAGVQGLHLPPHAGVG